MPTDLACPSVSIRTAPRLAGRLAALALAALPLAAAAPPARAQGAINADRSDPQIFRDDRSDPASIVSSLYNAINARQYARAWSYFGQKKPVVSYKAFTAGYADTRHVTLRIGDVTLDGTAGTTHGKVPVAIRAEKQDGSRTVYGGCYLTSQLDPDAQTPPYQPLRIDSGKLVRKDLALDQAIPLSCADDGTPQY